MYLQQQQQLQQQQLQAMSSEAQLPSVRITVTSFNETASTNFQLLSDWWLGTQPLVCTADKVTLRKKKRHLFTSICTISIPVSILIINLTRLNSINQKEM